MISWKIYIYIYDYELNNLDEDDCCEFFFFKLGNWMKIMENQL
jgi:hypothetical protein